jgi:hypothetical protein
MKKVLIFTLFLFLVTPAQAAADGGYTKTPDLVMLTSTQAQTITLPYEFEAIDYSGAATEDLDINLTDVSFINQVGSIALTLMSILDNFAILGIFVVLLMAIGVVFWIWSLVTETPHTATLNVFNAAEVGAEMYDTHLMLQEGDIDRQARLMRGDPGYWTGQRALVSGRRQDVARFRSVSRAVKRGTRRLKNPFK